MKKILFVVNFIVLPWENGNSRFIYILSKLNKKENDVEVITSDFSHGEKKHRDKKNTLLNEQDYKISLIEEPGYKKNVCLRRFYSHFVLSRNIAKYIKDKVKKKKKIDIIYLSVPSLSVAKAVTKIAKKNNIRLIIDIQDLWPEAFKMVFHVPIISDIIFFPMKKQAEFVYKYADDIIAVSETYKNRALKVNKKCKKAISVFLGTDLKKFDEIAKNVPKKATRNIYLAYIGTLGNSYNIKCIIDAIALARKRTQKILKFIVMGDGPLRNDFEKYAKEKNVPCDFLGNLPYIEMIKKLVNCDIAVNPIKKGAAQSIINKVGDYAAAGLPVINTQECEEYKNLVTSYNFGFNCDNEDVEEIAEKIVALANDDNLRKKFGEGNRKLAKEKFDRNITYKKIVNIFNEEKK